MNIVQNPIEGSEVQNSSFPSKIALHLKKCCYKVSVCECCQQQHHSLAYLCKNGSRGTSPATWKFSRNWPTSFKNANFQSIFTCSTSAITPGEKVELTQMGSLLRTVQWA